MNRVAWIATFYLLTLQQAPAIDQIQLNLGNIDSETFSAENVSLSLDLIDADTIELILNSDRLTSPIAGKLQNLKLQCSGVMQAQQIHCRQGRLTAQHELLKEIDAGISFSYHLIKRSASLEIKELISKQDHIHARISPRNNGWNMHLGLADIELQSIKALLESRYPQLNEFHVDAGSMAVQVDAEIIEDGRLHLAGESRLTDIFMEGENVIEGATLHTNFIATHENQHWSFTTQSDLSDGAIYVVPGFAVLGDRPGFYLDLTQQPVSLTVNGNTDADFNSIQVDQFTYTHPGLLKVTASGKLDRTGAELFNDVKLSISSEQLSKIFPIYVQPVLLSTNYGELELVGSLDLNLHYQGGNLSALQLSLHDIYLDDKSERFSISGLNSHIMMDETAHTRISDVAWDALSIYRVIFGRGEMQFESKGRDFKVVDWHELNVLDGQLLINTLAIANLGQEDFSLQLDGELSPISLPNFTQAMGWPLMTGRLSGSISGLNYSRDNLSITGDIHFRVFDGDIVLTGLEIDNIFTDYSTLRTDIRVDGLDLEQLTDTFTFGKIQGSLSGHLQQFTLQSWQPVYFDAWLATPADDERPHRISQKALDNLSELGAGITGSLSRGFLRFIPEYSYGRLGFSCLLSNGICNLGGVQETADGFYLLTRGGLLPPWVDVKGTGRSIAWADLIGGLKRIAQGEVVVE